MSDAPQQAGAPAKVLVLTAYDPPFAGLAALTVPRMRAFSERHGYAFRETRVSDAGRRPVWMKITALRQALDEDHDLIMWIDVDALILRLDVDLRGALPPGKDLGMVWHGGDAVMPNGVPAHLNAGVLMVRPGSWSRDFFRRVAETRLKHYWQEQAAMLHLLGYDAALGLGPDRPQAPDRQQVARLDPAWNAIPAVATVADPIIHHWAGISGPARERGRPDRFQHQPRRPQPAFELRDVTGFLPPAVHQFGDRAPRRLAMGVAEAKHRHVGRDSPLACGAGLSRPVMDDRVGDRGDRGYRIPGRIEPRDPLPVGRLRPVRPEAEDGVVAEQMQHRRLFMPIMLEPRFRHPAEEVARPGAGAHDDHAVVEVSR
ncbi:MAG: hypothetical protein QOD94_3086, partial [Alphaproteobacteria bacterium]|nr:hypothetical protein [Alphaproteobacteria bacterium]